MRKLKLFCLGLFLISCGDRIEREVKYLDRIVEVETTKEFSFAGNYFLSNNSFIKVLEDVDGFVYIQSNKQLLTTINPKNGTFGEMPKFSTELYPVGGKLKITLNLNFTDGNDIEEDVTGSDIRGSKRVDIEITKNSENLLVVKFQVYKNQINKNVNYIIAERIFVQE